MSVVNAIMRTCGLILVTLLGAVLVVGSGGGGGDNPTARSELVSLTDANAVAIAGEAWLAVGANVDLTLPPLDVDPATLSCDNAPTGTFSFTSNGSAVTYTFHNCVIGLAGATFDGSLVVEPLSSVPDPFDPAATVWTLTARVTLNQFTVNDGTNTFTMDGTFTGTTSTTDGEITIDTTVTGSLVNWELNGVGATMFDFTFLEHDDTATSTVGTGGQGEIQGVAFGGRVAFQITNTFTNNVGSFPFEGSMVITGANGSTVTLTAIDEVSVRLDVVDETGATFTIDTTWAILTGA